MFADIERLVKGYGIHLAVGVGAMGLMYLMSRKRRKLPPGPYGYPVLGAVRELKSGVMHEDFLRLAVTYGDVISLYVGDTLLVALNSYDAIKEAFVEHAEDFSDRPQMTGMIEDNQTFEDEIFLAKYSPEWRKSKRFIVSALKTFGFGTSKGEANISTEATLLVQHLAQKSGEPLETGSLLSQAASNVMLSVLYGKRYDFDDPELLGYLQMIREFTSALDESGAFTMMPAFLRRFIAHDGSRKLHEAGRALSDFCERQIREHRATIDPENTRDFIDAYIAEKGAAGEDDTTRMMCNTVMMLTPDASDTMGIALQWALFNVAYHEETQARAQREIDAVVGGGRKPCLADRPSMPYTEALINETLRMCPAFAVTISHTTHRDVKFRGYDIPAGSHVFGNLWSVLYNPTFFKDPNVFNPARFLSPDGKFVKSSYHIPYSTGKRSCIGEQLSRMEFFLFLTHILQMFNLRFPEDEERPSCEPVFYGLQPMPPKHRIIMDPRI